MDPNKTNLEVSQEELNAEKEIESGVTDEQLKTKIVEEFGLNPDTDTEMIEKLVEREKTHHKKLSDTIRQKISWREKATSNKPSDDKTKGGTLKEEDIANLVDQRIAERELNALELPDDLKAEIKDLAKLKNITVAEASRLPYIKTRIEEVKTEERIKNGTPKRTNANGKTILIDASKPLNPDDYDLSTEEGRKSWNDAKAERAKYRKEHS